MGLAQNMQWTAIILAGQRPGADPLAEHFSEQYKARVPIAGEAMLTHVLRTLHSCPQVARVIVVAQDTCVLADAIEAGGGAETARSGDGISASLLQLLDDKAADLPWLVTTADHPLLTQAMVDEFLGEAKSELSIGMVERQVMLSQFPEAQRTWLRFSDGAWSGTNLFAFRSDNIRRALLLWMAAEKNRKQTAKLLWHFGPVLALRALTRTISLQNAIARAGKRLGVDAQIVPLSDPIAAIDVDKPADHALASQIIAKRRDL